MIATYALWLRRLAGGFMICALMALALAPALAQAAPLKQVELAQLGQTDEETRSDDQTGADEVEWLSYEDQLVQATATLTGLTVEQVWEQLDAGKSLAEIAADHGKTSETLDDALLAEEQTWIDEVLAEGWITQDEAGEWQAEMQRYFAELIATPGLYPTVFEEINYAVEE